MTVGFPNRHFLLPSMAMSIKKMVNTIRKNKDVTYGQCKHTGQSKGIQFCNCELAVVYAGCSAIGWCFEEFGIHLSESAKAV